MGHTVVLLIQNPDASWPYRAFLSLPHFCTSGGADPRSAPSVGHRADAAAEVRGLRPKVALGVVQTLLGQLRRHPDRRRPARRGARRQLHRRRWALAFPENEGTLVNPYTILMATHSILTTNKFSFRTADFTESPFEAVGEGLTISATSTSKPRRPPFFTGYSNASEPWHPRFNL